MKINGLKIMPPPNETLVIPRADREYVFQMKMVTDYSQFEAVCPIPEAPVKILPGQDPVPQLSDPAYRVAVQKRGRQRIDYMILVSLQATEWLTWERVDMNSPDTYHFYEDELKEAGFPVMHINQIIDKVFIANGLNQEKIEAATQRFLAGQANQASA